MTHLLKLIPPLSGEVATLNYWGYTPCGCAALGCLNCGVVRYDFKHFVKHGPRLGSHRYFCDACHKLFLDHFFDRFLGQVKPERLSEWEIFNRTMDDWERCIVEGDRDKCKDAEFKGTRWVFLG